MESLRLDARGTRDGLAPEASVLAGAGADGGDPCREGAGAVLHAGGGGFADTDPHALIVEVRDVVADHGLILPRSRKERRMPIRKAEAEWKGGLKDGKGNLKLGSGAFE